MELPYENRKIQNPATPLAKKLLPATIGVGSELPLETEKTDVRDKLKTGVETPDKSLSNFSVKTPNAPRNWVERKQDEATYKDRFIDDTGLTQTQKEQLAQDEADRKRYTPPKVSQTQVSQNFDAKEGLSGDVDSRIDDVIENASGLGAKGNEAMQNIKVPRNKMYTIRDIMNDPELEGMRDYLVADQLGTMWKNVGENLAGRAGNYKSRVDEYNDVMNETYAKNKANVDTSATQGNIDAIQAGLAQQVALETNLADTVANEYIKRYKALQDAEDKKLLLKKMKDDDEVWAKLTDKQKLDLAGYMGITSGDYSLTDLLIQKYAPQLLDGLDAFMDTLTGGKWSEWRRTNGGNGSPTPSNEPVETGEPTDNNNTITLFGGDIVPQEDVINNPDKYMEIPTGMGQTMLVRRFSPLVQGQTSSGIPAWQGYSREQIDEFEQALMNNPNLSDEERLAYAKDWAGKMRENLTDSEMRKLMSDRDKGEKARLKAEEEQQKAVTDNTTKLQAIRDNLVSGKINGSQALQKLWGINKDLLDPASQAVYNGVVETANRNVISTKYEEIKNGNLSTKEKIDEYDKLLNGDSSQYMSPLQKVNIERAKADAEVDYNVREPYQRAVDSWYSKNTTKKTDEIGGTVSSKLTKDGLFEKQGTHDLKPVVYNPSTMTEPTVSNDYMQTLLDLTEPNTVAKMVPGATIEEKVENLKLTPVYKAMAKFLGNNSLKDMAYKTKKGKYTNQGLKLTYDTLTTRFNKIMNGTLFEM